MNTYTITFDASGKPIEAAQRSERPAEFAANEYEVTAALFAAWQTTRRKPDGTFADDPSLVTTPVLTKVFKVNVWKNATDLEAEKLVAKLAEQPLRLRKSWEDARYLETTDDTFALVKSAFVQAIGQARADILLAPTE